MLEGGREAVQANEDVVGTSRVSEREKQVRDLERLLGRKTMEVEILKEALDFARVKNDVAAGLLEQSGGQFPMRAVAETLGIARSNLAERQGMPARPRGPYRKSLGTQPSCRSCASSWMSILASGYRRLAALLNRHLRSQGQPTVNRKRMLRILQVNGLTSERHTAHRPPAHMRMSWWPCAPISAGTRINWNCDLSHRLGHELWHSSIRSKGRYQADWRASAETAGAVHSYRGPPWEIGSSTSW
jgi:hypothetical protein